MHAALTGGLGLRNRELLINTLAYGLLTLAIIIIFLPLAWMLTVSVRPNLEVMKMPPDWIPQVFTLEGYAKIFSNPRYLVVFLNTTDRVSHWSRQSRCFSARWQPMRSRASSSSASGPC
jgi:multiple sugar transport system permease protein